MTCRGDCYSEPCRCPPPEPCACDVDRSNSTSLAAPGQGCCSRCLQAICAWIAALAGAPVEIRTEDTPAGRLARSVLTC